MTTAIIGIGNIGSRVARNLVEGGERVILTSHDRSATDSMAEELGELASSATTEDAVEQADAVVLAVSLDAEKDLVSALAGKLEDKVVIDPSNPIAPDSQGGFTNALPERQTAAQIVSGLLPAGARYVKAFGTLSADDLGSASRRSGDRVALFYATDDDAAARTVERLIAAAGFDPVRAGGLDAAGRLEMLRGDLHQHGGLDGKLLSADEARAAV
ncbi:NADPH-dependent F420 reductase [Arthrobacter echini]|nr:NAD(P)-binding domain-containing protein [Arthrobacter echini]